MKVTHMLSFGNELIMLPDRFDRIHYSLGHLDELEVITISLDRLFDFLEVRLLSNPFNVLITYGVRYV